MKMRNFGKLGIQGSALGLGCMRFPKKEVDGKMVVDEENAINIIRTAIDGGVTYMDTAYVYLDQTSEVILGKALQDGYRERVTIATKLPTWMVEKEEDMQRFFDEELARLQTDHIDFYLVHSLSAERWSKIKALGICQFLDRLKKEGKIRFACFSFHDDYKVFETILNDYDWDMCQIQYNFMDINNQAGTKGLELAGSKGIPVVVMEGLLGGRLAKAPDNVQALYDAFPVKRSPVEWAFRWLCNHPQVATVLSGLTSVEQVKDNLRIFDTVEPGCMSKEELELIDKVRDAYNSRIKVGCTGCAYCMPCPMGVDIPGSFSAWNNASLYGGLGKGNADYKRLEEEGKAPTQCVECGACMQVCPQHLEIPELLKKVTADLK